MMKNLLFENNFDRGTCLLFDLCEEASEKKSLDKFLILQENYLI